MKYRLSFVTNSSSSSFIISKSDISKKDLMKLLLEMANEDSDLYGYEPYTNDDIRDGGIGNFYVLDSSVDDVYYWEPEGKKIDKNSWVVNNDTTCRFNWEAIDDIFEREGIKYQYGYCD